MNEVEIYQGKINWTRDEKIKRRRWIYDVGTRDGTRHQLLLHSAMQKKKKIVPGIGRFPWCKNWYQNSKKSISHFSEEKN